MKNISSNTLYKGAKYLFYVSVVMIILVITLGIGSYLLDDGGGISDVRVTNISSNSATVSWVTEDPTIGRVFFSEGEGNWTPILGKFTADFHYDDRDVEQNEDGEYILKEAGAVERYTHHVTIRDLDPETEYSFRIFGFTKLFDGGIDARFSTYAVQDELRVPDPAYGKVIYKDSSKRDPVDGIVYYQIYHKDYDQFDSQSDQSKISNVYSTTLNLKSTWSADFGLILNSEGDLFDRLPNDSDNYAKIEIVSERGDAQYTKPLENYKPLENIIVGDESEDLSSYIEFAPNIEDSLFSTFSSFDSDFIQNVSASTGQPCNMTGDHCNSGSANPDYQYYRCEGGYWQALGTYCNERRPDNSTPPSNVSTSCNYGRCNMTGTHCNSGSDNPDFQYYTCINNCWVPQGTYCNNNPTPTPQPRLDLNQVTCVADPRPAESQERNATGTFLHEGNCYGYAGNNCIVEREMSACPLQQELGEPLKPIGEFVSSYRECATQHAVQCSFDTPRSGQFVCVASYYYHRDVVSYCGGTNRPTCLPGQARLSQCVGKTSSEFAIHQNSCYSCSGQNINFGSGQVQCATQVADASCSSAVATVTPEPVDNPTPDTTEITFDGSSERPRGSNTKTITINLVTNSQLPVSYVRSTCQVIKWDFSSNNADTSTGVGNRNWTFYYRVNQSETSCSFYYTSNGQEINVTHTTDQSTQIQHEINKNLASNLTDLESNLVGKVSANVDNDLTLDVGTYEVVVSGITSELIIENDNTTVRYFDDLNRDGIKQDNEPFADLSELNIAINKTSDLVFYNLNEGWNLIAFEGVSSEWSSASELVEYINSEHESLVTHISGYIGGKWQLYSSRVDSDTNFDFGEDFTIVPGRGYFVRTTYQQSVGIELQKFAESVPVDFVNGWNLVSIQGPSLNYKSESFLDKCSSSGLLCDSLAKYDSGNYEVVVKEGGVFYGNDFNLISKSGYFVRVQSGGPERLVP